MPDLDPEAAINHEEIENVARNIPPGAEWYVSPLMRTIQTSEALAKFVTYKTIFKDKNLIEQNFGDWQGKKISEVWNELQQDESKHNFSFLPRNYST